MASQYKFASRSINPTLQVFELADSVACTVTTTEYPVDLPPGFYRMELALSANANSDDAVSVKVFPYVNAFEGAEQLEGAMDLTIAGAATSATLVTIAASSAHTGNIAFVGLTAINGAGPHYHGYPNGVVCKVTSAATNGTYNLRLMVQEGV